MKAKNICSSIMRWDQLLCDDRFGQDPEGIENSQLATSHKRTDFERDYDRIIFSAPFRRLQNKAQIFPLPGKIFVHNRLTHSLEVSCVGRSLGNCIAEGLSERYNTPYHEWRHIAAIVSAACLAHDIGNPPFGHSGERAIRSYFTEGNGGKWEKAIRKEGMPWEDFVYYEGNANALRLLTHQFRGRRPGGFALTYTTLAAMVKYPWESGLAKEKHKFGFFATEKKTYQQIAKRLGLLQQDSSLLSYARHPLVYLMEAADDICYQIMDLEDAYKLRILTFGEVSDLLLSFFDAHETSSITSRARNIRDNNERIAFLRSKAINKLTEACAEVFLSNENDLLQGKWINGLVSKLPSTLKQAYMSCSQVAKSKVYTAQEVIDVELAGHRIFGELIDRVMHSLLHPEQSYSRTLLSYVSSQYNTEEISTYGKLMCTLDYISGMTDVFALDIYRRITGMSLPAI